MASYSIYIIYPMINNQSTHTHTHTPHIHNNLLPSCVCVCVCAPLFKSPPLPFLKKNKQQNLYLILYKNLHGTLSRKKWIKTNRNVDKCSVIII